ncbi:MAG: peptidoglycan-binding protein LysM [Brachymonas sp.]|nr:peptidoglycan-binding protein LysM [Brachymonas sp.]
MGLFSFIKEAGEKLFGMDKKPDAADTASVTELNAKAADAIKKYIETQNLGLSNLNVMFDGAAGKVTVTGDAPSREAYEKVTLAAGNVAHVNEVDNNMQITGDGGGAEAQYHDVVSGDTLSAIAKKYYGDANKYNAIFEANKPMLSHPDKIYPGQKLRIPAL